MTLVSRELFELLACPVDKAPLREDSEASVLVCTRCGRQYPVRDAMPHMLIEEAEGDPDD